MLPNPQTVLILTEQHKLCPLSPSGSEHKIADLRWLVPGWDRGNVGIRWDFASGAAQRILFSSWGARIPITDTSGFGYYLPLAVVDVPSKAIVFRKQYPIGSEVAISPNRHLLAVQMKTRLPLEQLP